MGSLSKLLISARVGSGVASLGGEGWKALRDMSGLVGDGILYVLVPDVMFNLLRPIKNETTM